MTTGVLLLVTSSMTSAACALSLLIGLTRFVSFMAEPPLRTEYSLNLVSMRAFEVAVAEDRDLRWGAIHLSGSPPRRGDCEPLRVHKRCPSQAGLPPTFASPQN